MKNAELKQIYDDKIDLYDVLRFDDRKASSSDLRKRFRQLALEYHPDKNPEDTEVIHKFHLISLAADILTNDHLRGEYDLWWDQQLALNKQQSQRGEWVARLERREKKDTATNIDVNRTTDFSSIQKYGEYLRKLKHFNVSYNWSPQTPSEQSFCDSSTLRLEIETNNREKIKVLQEEVLRSHLESLFRVPIHSIYYSTRNRPGDPTMVAYVIFQSPTDSRLIYKRYKDQILPSPLTGIQPRIPISYYKNHTQTPLEPRIESLVANRAVQID
ncbi:hypothetical protein ZYGR_0W00110 [Zygosaccharomyces rouxii]|uniref:J domain-containing protein n=1 Tax=Zygosaccharomyces rouxii TaxID=4956 RepID=A0A1Q3A447_ZYGRO|nr:hypothetical protein ZYGR_0W00110 [Zygosaccharomyces rouxii]